MSKRTFEHRHGRKGVEVVETTQPRHRQGYDEYSVHTFTEGPLKRLFSKKGIR